MDAIVTAGGLCGPDDPLFAATGVSKKALIPLAGRPMVAWIVDALHHASHIDHIVVIGLDEGEVEFGGIPVSLRPNRGNLVDNILAGVEVLQAINPGGGKFTLSSSDIPLITPEIVDGFIEDCLKVDADVYYTVVDKETMERRFPGSNRSFIPLKGGSYAGGDLFLIDLKAVQLNLELLRDLTDSRKNYWAQALKRARHLSSSSFSDVFPCET
jgi:GTP:adenosylcobinamide-phosphate guanylyltransferase